MADDGAHGRQVDAAQVWLDPGLAWAWRGAPVYLRVLAVLGVPWSIALVVVGVPLLVESGPGLPLIMLGMMGVVPWVVMVTRSR